MKEFTEFKRLLIQFNQETQDSAAPDHEKNALSLFCRHADAIHMRIDAFPKPEQRQYIYLSFIMEVLYYYIYAIEREGSFTPSLLSRMRTPPLHGDSAFLNKTTDPNISVIQEDKLIALLQKHFEMTDLTSLDNFANLIGTRHDQLLPFASRTTLGSSKSSPTACYQQLIDHTEIYCFLIHISQQATSILHNAFDKFIDTYQSGSKQQSHLQVALDLESKYISHKDAIDAKDPTALLSLICKLIETHTMIDSGSYGKGMLFSSGSKLKLQITELCQLLNISAYLDNSAFLAKLQSFLHSPVFHYDPMLSSEDRLAKHEVSQGNSP